MEYVDELRGFDLCAVVEHRCLGGLAAGAGDLREAQPGRRTPDLIPLDTAQVEGVQAVLHKQLNLLSARKAVADDVVEPPKEGGVEDFLMVGRRQDEAVGVVCFEELEEGV